MGVLDIEDYLYLRDKIRKEKKPLLIKRSDGQKIAIVLSPEAKVFYKKRGFQVFILEELFNQLLNYDNFKDQKEIIESIFRVVNAFDGQVI